MKLELDLPKEKWEEIVSAIQDGARHVGNYETTSRSRAEEYARIEQDRYDLAGLIEYDILNRGEDDGKDSDTALTG